MKPPRSTPRRETTLGVKIGPSSSDRGNIAIGWALINRPLPTTKVPAPDWEHNLPYEATLSEKANEVVRRLKEASIERPDIKDAAIRLYWYSSAKFHRSRAFREGASWEEHTALVHLVQDRLQMEGYLVEVEMVVDE